VTRLPRLPGWLHRLGRVPASRLPVLTGWRLRSGAAMTALGAALSVSSALGGCPAVAAVFGGGAAVMLAWCCISARRGRPRWTGEDRAWLEETGAGLPEAQEELW
jgi:hypothetical protein